MGCTPYTLSDPGPLVYNGWDTFSGYARDGFDLAAEQIGRITDFSVAFHTWDASFAPTGSTEPFVRPTRPDYPLITAPDLSGTIPDAPTLQVTPITLDTAPAEPSDLLNPPTLVEPTRPDPVTLTPPGDVPTLSTPDLPTAPELNTPTAPTLIEVELPEVPTITVTEFAESAPTFDAPPPSELLEFTEDPYVSALLDTVRSKIQTWIDNDGRIPESLATYLWDKAVSRDDLSAAKLVQEVSEDFAARGFDVPPGMMAERLLEVRQANRNQRASLTRDIYIQEETLAVQNLQFAVQQGISLEATLLQAHLATEQRRFELVKAVKDVALAVFNAQVTAYNASVAAYNARVAAYNAFLDGLRAQVDIYRAQVEAAKVRGEINEQAVRAYAEQVRAELARAEAYRAQVEGFKAQIEAEKATIDGYRAQVEAYEARVRAHGIEWDAYKAQLGAEVERGRLYATLVDAYGNRVKVWQTKGQMRIEQQRADLAQAQAFLQQHDAQVRTVLAKLEAVRTLVQAQSAQADATARIYAADAQVETAASDAAARAFQAETERAREGTLLALKDAELQITQLNQRASLLLRGYESAAQAASQLAASSMSAVNLSAGISSSASLGQSCSTSFSYSGEIADYAG